MENVLEGDCSGSSEASEALEVGKSCKMGTDEMCTDLEYLQSGINRICGWIHGKEGFKNGSCM